MKKFRFKRFVIVFFILIAIQFVVALLDIKFYQDKSDFLSITNALMTIFSMPIGLIHNGLPFYINEPLPIKVVFWVVNVIVQTAIILGVISLIRSLKESMKY